jgi:hypothetical protein
MAQQGDEGGITEWQALTRFKGDTANWKNSAD